MWLLPRHMRPRVELRTCSGTTLSRTGAFCAGDAGFRAGRRVHSRNGEIRFRGENWGIWAGDSQGGYILKAYREHQLSQDDAFLKRNWPNIRKATEFLIDQDGNADGLLEGQQHQTYDQNYFGPNTMVGSLYLGALRAAEEMARDTGDVQFADTCRKIFEQGQVNSVKQLFNGEYFIQKVDLEKHPEWQYADGCLADQMFGQGWAHQVNLGYLYPRETVLKSLESIWKYCWAPDVGLQNEKHKPERWFAYPGEAGLFTCTWPKSKHLGPKSTRYRNEIWTGIEYQVANHMAYEGMLTESLAICRAIHDRYHPRNTILSTRLSVVIIMRGAGQLGSLVGVGWISNTTDQNDTWDSCRV